MGEERRRDLIFTISIFLFCIDEINNGFMYLNHKSLTILDDIWTHIGPFNNNKIKIIECVSR